ncbi:hypothetical protein [Streptomyces sp. NPDC006270]|uniref:hypothetical protein n=1 Tax=Streptomyces sp. NPDC006270 TaxID=3364741 RepID=UPI00369A6ABE
MSSGEVSGIGLARQPLIAAREAAKRNGATRQKPKRRITTALRHNGREPLGLGSAIGMMMAERGMAALADRRLTSARAERTPCGDQVRRGEAAPVRLAGEHQS